MNTGRTRFKKGHGLGSSNVNWKGGKPRCLVCNKVLSTRTVRKKPVKYCHKHKAKLGSAHHNWIPKRSAYLEGKRLRSSAEYKLWRASVFERDRFTCQKCRKSGVYLEAHHIKSWAKFPKSRFRISNGQTLCRLCHSKTDNYKGRAKLTIYKP